MSVSSWFLLFPALWCGFSRAQAPLFTPAPGQNLTVSFAFNLPGNRRRFCRNYCDDEGDVLVASRLSRTQSGRYSLEYEDHQQHHVMSVSITNISLRDQGRYRCVLEQWDRPTSGTYHFFSDFFIQVSADPTPSPSGLPECQLCSSVAPGLCLAPALVAVIVTLVAIIFLCWRKKLKRRRATQPPDPASTDHSPRATTEDSNNTTYAEVDFSQSHSSSAPVWRTEAVVYSVPKF